ncbi:MAG: YitT family protein [Massilibacteroides sp.]|nr:YitT family protein [Massilibacteroides sp.]
MNKANIGRLYNHAQDYLIIILGTLLYGFGFNAFILSNEVVTGGVSGICAIIYFATSIPVSISYFVLNLILLVIAFKILGFKFLIKTIVGVVSLSLSLSLFEYLFANHPLIDSEPFMSILIGAALCGSGLGLIFSVNGSTGGTDIIAMIINKYKNISIGTALFFCDFLIISSSYILFQNVEKIVFGFIEMGVSNYVLDLIINRNRQSVQFFIFSQKYEEIAKRIIHDMNRGCTFLEGQGGYSKQPMKVIVLLAKRSESLTIFRLVKDVDPNAFISQSNVRGVYGEGFDQIKT